MNRTEHDRNDDTYFTGDPQRGGDGLLKHGVKPNPFYKTTNQEYNPKWELTQDTTIKDYTVPTFKDVLAKK